ncbi:MAG: uroporphyrinogen-III C-methyltransferase [Bradyrhizobium sp.]|nr:uroporphyrinogen-III C-methyltransferase [Bradyrhizobium sp.]
MRFLPVFLDLQAGTVLLLGAGELAQSRLRVLAAAGAKVRFYSPSAAHDVGGLSPAQAAKVDLAEGDALAADLNGVVAVCCAGAGQAGILMSERARVLGLPVNVMDDPAHSTFIFPAIVDRGDVVVAIGTQGAAPVVARRVRERIEAVLPARIGELANFVGRFRKSIHDRIDEFALRRRFWERLIDGPIGALILAGRAVEAEAALVEIGDASAFAGALSSGEAEGCVTLVGGGPGDPDLLTVKALRTLQDADIVFHDEEISPEILDRIRRDAPRVAVSRRSTDQDIVTQRIIAAAKSGRRVVRLKAGDAVPPQQGGKELSALREAGLIHFVVPGIGASCGEVRPFSPSTLSRTPRPRATNASNHHH